MVGDDVHLVAGCHIGPDYCVGMVARRGPGVAVLDRTRLPGAAAPAMVGAGATVEGGAVIAGTKVGEGAFVARGEPGACNPSWT